MRNPSIISSLVVIVVLLGLGVYLIPPSWAPELIRPYNYSSLVRPTAFEPLPATKNPELGEVVPFCQNDNPEWRAQQVIDGVAIEASPLCAPDNPSEVAAFVKGTNNVSHMTLMNTRLMSDAVVKTDDLDNDGDPDVIHIRLEVAELNGKSTLVKGPFPSFSIAPGVDPGFWVFAPKTRGMATKNFESLEANRLLRMPSPTIRVEQGDRIKLTLENTHYMPHTIHLHGVDHPFATAEGKGNDGVPQTSEKMIMPGQSRTYEFTPRSAGSRVYHCHVQPPTHVMMGLFGMIVIEENKPNNWVQSFNIGSGHVRHPSVGVREEYDREYDMIYQGVDPDLHNIIQKYNDPRLIAEAMNRGHDVTLGKSRYFTLNGKSFPYTLEESLIVVKPNKNVKLRVINGSDDAIAPHTHGHTATITHYDGIKAPPGAQITRDVFSIDSAQRLDLRLNTTNDGLHNYGEGIWPLHDHREKQIASAGMFPGGGITAIVYEKYMAESGLPKLQGVDVSPYLTKEYYAGQTPVWIKEDPLGLFGQVERGSPSLLRVISFGLIVGALLGALLLLGRTLCPWAAGRE
jgi:manganese oxidase